MSNPSLPEKKRISAREFLVATRGPYRRLFSFLKPYRGRFIIGLICGALFGALNGALIFSLRYVTSEVLPKEEPVGRGNTTVVETWHEQRELPELEASLVSLPEAARTEAVEAYRKFRMQLHERSLQLPPENQPDPLTALSLPDSLPAEFRLCLEGERQLASKGPAAAPASNGLTDGLPSGEILPHIAAARKDWEALLDLPADQRRHRTVWARYLLARTDPDKSARASQLRLLHDDVESGKFTDVLNLVSLAPPSPPFGKIVLICLTLPLLMIMRAIFGYFNAYCLTWVSLRVLNDIRSQLFQRIMAQSMEFFNKQKSGDLMQTILNQTRVAQETLSTVAGYIVKEPIAIISALGMLFYLDWKFTLMTLVLFPLLIVPVTVVGKKVRRLAAAEEREAGNMAVIMQEALIGVREVKSYNREPHETGRFKKSNWLMLSNMLRWRKALEATGPAVEVMSSLGVAGALLYVWKLDMPAGDFLALNAGLLLLYTPVKSLSRVPILLQRCLASTTNVFDLMDRNISVKDAPDAKALPPVAGGIGFEKVTFAYGGEAPALRGVTLDIAPHETVAFVGRSGAGKSTIFSLLLRLYDPQSGRVLLDGHDIRSITQESLRAQIGVVSQDVFLFHDTIHENIRYGRLDATDEEIHEAARRAHAHDFILAQPQGYQTVIGDKGSLLSGGQRQRISIARAFLKNAPVLLLDEATSALDPEAERHIQEAIRDLAEGKTVLAIAHRLSTVIKSDRIIVMQDGAITAAGPHAILLETSDLYRSLYTMQFHTAET